MRGAAASCWTLGSGKVGENVPETQAASGLRGKAEGHTGAGGPAKL